MLLFPALLYPLLLGLKSRCYCNTALIVVSTLDCPLPHIPGVCPGHEHLQCPSYQTHKRGVLKRLDQPQLGLVGGWVMVVVVRGAVAA